MSSGGGANPRYVAVQSIVEAYPRRWVAMEVGERDSATGQPITGRLLAQSVERNHVRDLIKGRENISIFYTGSVPVDGFELMI